MFEHNNKPYRPANQAYIWGMDYFLFKICSERKVHFLILLALIILNLSSGILRCHVLISTTFKSLLKSMCRKSKVFALCLNDGR